MLNSVFFTESAFRVCSATGLWINKDGVTGTAEGWTNYTACFIPEVRNLLYQLYSGTEEDAQVSKNLNIVDVYDYY